jgi:hypothetical protein
MTDGLRCGDDDLLLFISFPLVIIILEVSLTDAAEVINASKASADFEKRI